MTEFERSFDAGADDLLAVIDAVKKRPDADASRIIAVGASAGGAVAIALGARNPPGLVGVVSVSGGLRSSCPTWKDRLTEAYKTYGAESHVPNLWLYAKNDSYFAPDVVERLKSAFLSGGGLVQLTEFDPVEKVGHNLFQDGALPWLGELDRIPSATSTADVEFVRRY